MTAILGAVLSTLNGGALSVAQIAAQLPDVTEEQIATALYNAVRRGKAINLNEGKSTKLGGLYAVLEHGLPRAKRAAGSLPASLDFAPLLGAWR